MKPRLRCSKQNSPEHVLLLTASHGHDVKSFPSIDKDMSRGCSSTMPRGNFRKRLRSRLSSSRDDEVAVPAGGSELNGKTVRRFPISMSKPYEINHQLLGHEIIKCLWSRN